MMIIIIISSEIHGELFFLYSSLFAFHGSLFPFVPHTPKREGGNFLIPLLFYTALIDNFSEHKQLIGLFIFSFYLFIS